MVLADPFDLYLGDSFDLYLGDPFDLYLRDPFYLYLGDPFVLYLRDPLYGWVKQIELLAVLQTNKAQYAIALVSLFIEGTKF